MRSSRRLLVLVVTMLLCGLLATGCDGLVADPNFHTWCGDTLCSWKLEAGHIQRAPTWHPKDYGVELLDTPTVLSQHIDATPKCLEFTTVADVAIEAQVFVGVDFDDDGTVDYEQPIAATGFTEQKTQITAPKSYSNFKLIISKRGTGHAVLAQLDIDDQGDCTAAPSKLTPQIEGTRCSPSNGGDECKSGVCCNGVCSECCGTNVAACGAGTGAGGTEAGADADGGVDGGVDQGPTCGTLPIFSFSLTGAIPSQCEPGKYKRDKARECLLDADCKSGKCTGAVWNIKNLVVDGGVCPPPPIQGQECNVESVRAGVCE